MVFLAVFVYVLNAVLEGIQHLIYSFIPHVLFTIFLSMDIAFCFLHLKRQDKFKNKNILYNTYTRTAVFLPFFVCSAIGLLCPFNGSLSFLPLILKLRKFSLAIPLAMDLLYLISFAKRYSALNNGDYYIE